MKNLIIIAVLMLFIAFSCKKESQVLPDYKVTINQLSGDWETVQFSYNGDTLLNDSVHINPCITAYNNSITHGKGFVFIRLNKIDTISHICEIQDCMRSDGYTFELLPDKINFTLTQTSTIDYTFDILSYDGKSLILKLTYSAYPQSLIGAIYTLKRPVIHPVVSQYAGRWINDYVLVDYVKDTVAERYQFQFFDGGQAIMTSANDTSVHKVYNSWIVFQDNLELINGNDVMLYNIVLPTTNTMILSVYNYKYYLTKVK